MVYTRADGALSSSCFTQFSQQSHWSLLVSCVTSRSTASTWRVQKSLGSYNSFRSLWLRSACSMFFTPLARIQWKCRWTCLRNMWMKTTNSLMKTTINLLTPKLSQWTKALMMSIKARPMSIKARKIPRSNCWHLRKKRTKPTILSWVTKYPERTRFTSTFRKLKNRRERDSRKLNYRKKLKRLAFATCSSRMLLSWLLNKEGHRRTPIMQVAHAERRRCSLSKRLELIK